MDLQKKDKNTPSTNLHEGHRERMRQRLAVGDLDSYQTHEIVEMMLYQANKRCDTNVGSYSRVRTVAFMPSLFLLKSIILYLFLFPPPL